MAGRRDRRAPRRSARQEEARLRAAHAVSLQRHDPALSLSQAARKAGTTGQTVLAYFGTSVVREANGRYRIHPADREAFRMLVISQASGLVEATVRGSGKRELLGAHHSAIRRFLAAGDVTALWPFEGQTVAGLHLLTDPDELVELWRRGQFNFLEIYATTGL